MQQQQLNKQPGLIFIIISILFSGTCWYFANSLNGAYWYCLWIAPVLVLIASFRVKAIWGYVIAYLAYAIGRLSWFGYLSIVINRSIALQITLTLPLLFALFIVIVRAIVRRTNSWLSVFAYPVFITLSEYIMLQTSHDGSASSMAYSQMNFLPIIQIASVTGILGITFIVSFIPSAIAVGWYHYENKKQFKPLIVTSSLLIIFVLLFGVIRLWDNKPANTIKAGIVSLNEKIYIISKRPDFNKALDVTRQYASAIDKLAADGARIVVIPERALNINDSINAATLSILRTTAMQNNVYIAAAYTNFKESKPRNSALIIDNTGRILVDYNKMHFVPVLEDWFTPGNKTGLFAFNNMSAGIAICKDLDFPGTINQYGKSGIGFMIVPAWDFEIDDWMHCRMAVLRGVENGFAEVRAARQGRLTISDAYGRILKETSTAGGEKAFLTGDVPINHLHTIYSKYDDWFGIFDCIAAGCFIVALLFRRRVPRPNLLN